MKGKNSMKLGIMQPYFFPYIGYWQLMNAVDKYVIYDDVNFIKGGWINRNRILLNGEGKYFNLPMQGASSNKKINKVGVNNDEPLINKNLRIIEACYKKAPYYNEVYPILVRILKCGETNLATFIKYSFDEICQYLGINTELIMSSNLNKDNSLKAQEKVIHICEKLGANEYYNAIGGQELYSYDDFLEHNIQLNFLKTGNIVYHQYGDNFVPNLSIIDVMMFNSREEIRKMLNDYQLITSQKKVKVYEKKK